MHYVVIWQDDPGVEQILKPLNDRGAGAGVLHAGGHHVRLYRMRSEARPKGEWYDPLPIFSAIFSTADHALGLADRLARMHVMFIFHQTSGAAVRAIMGALKLLTPDALDGLAVSHGKNLQVEQVVLLSCESAADKVVAEPVPTALAPWVRQARDMRAECLRAFSIRRIDGSGEFIPTIVTFSTGDVETGGIVLDPWRARFIRLNGHFTADGGWDYNLDANGQPDKTPANTGGSVHGDQPGSSPSVGTHGAGQSIPPLLPDFSQPNP